MISKSFAVNFRYLLAFLVLLAIEVCIALFVHDAIIRPYVGDILVVILIYLLIRSVVRKRIRFLPIYVFLFAAAVEVSQYFHIVNVLHLENNRVLSTIIGSTFEIEDLLCYLAGAGILMVWEYFEHKK